MATGERRVLVVEEPPDAIEELRPLQEVSDIKVDSVSTVDECLSQIQFNPPDLILFPISHNTIDGLQLVNSVRKVDPTLPVVVVTRGGDESRITELFKAGASDFFRYVEGHTELLAAVIKKNIQVHQQEIHNRANWSKLHSLNEKLRENLSTLQKDQAAGYRVQEAMMPATPASLGQVEFSYKIYPSLILSGDFVDYFLLPDGRVLFYIADVSGHGASSAFVTVLLKSLMRKLEYEFDDLPVDGTGSVLGWLNRELLFCELEQHITIFLAIIEQDQKVMTYSNAAQFPGTILCSSSETQYLEIGGLPLGLYDAPEYDSRSIDLEADFELVMFSDGVFEIMAEESLKAKEERLLSLVRCGNRSIESLADKLGVDKVDAIPDDIAIMTVARSR